MSSLPSVVAVATSSKRGVSDEIDQHDKHKRQRSDNKLPTPPTTTTSSTTNSSSSSSNTATIVGDDDDDKEQTVIMLPQFNDELAAKLRHSHRPTQSIRGRRESSGNSGRGRGHRGRGRARGAIAAAAGGSSGVQSTHKEKGAAILSSTQLHQTAAATAATSTTTSMTMTQHSTPTLTTASAPTTALTISAAASSSSLSDIDDINVPSKRMARVMAAHRERQRALMEEASEIAQRRAMGLEDSNDPLYDPSEDQADEAFAEQQQRAQQMKRRTSNRSSFQSHATLSCPCCFTNLCFDCQQHEEYEGQYRAVFVENCVDDIAETSEIKARPIRGDDEANTRYIAVRCGQCSAIVASRDEKEIYYFYNVIASPPVHVPSASPSTRQLHDAPPHDNDDNDENDDDDE